MTQNEISQNQASELNAAQGSQNNNENTNTIKEDVMSTENSNTLEQKNVVCSTEGETAAEPTTVASAESKKSVKSVVAPIKKYGPDVRSIHAEEMTRMAGDSRYHLTPIPGTSNAVINISAAVKNGIEFYRKKDNRIHGRDLQKTGESLMDYGAQLPLCVCSVKAAIEAGVAYERFSTDPNKDKPLSEDGLMVIEGHGRMEYLLQRNVQEWPVILGTFPVPDRDGEIHIENGFIELNRNDSVWGSKDYILIRLSDPTAHEGWKFIKQLEDKGIGFTIATIFATGRENTITKKAILNSTAEDVDSLFNDLAYGKRIFSAAENVFSVDRGSAILTKVLPNKIFSCWNDLTKRSSLTVDEATDYMVSFLNSLSVDSKAKSINQASKVGDKDRDTVRKELFSGYFEEYRKANPIA